METNLLISSFAQNSVHYLLEGDRSLGKTYLPPTSFSENVNAGNRKALLKNLESLPAAAI